MNECINKKKLFICELAIYIYEMESQERPTRLGTLPTFQNTRDVLNIPERLPRLPNSNFGKRFAANLFCLNWGCQGLGQEAQKSQEYGSQ